MAIHRYSSAGGIVIHEEDVLLLDRSAREEVRLPKGHIEEGEEPITAALRETAEEAGYDDLAVVADLGSRVVEFDYKGDHYIRTEHYFLMRLRSERQCLRDAKETAQFAVRWASTDVALAELTFSAERDALQRALAAARHD